MKTVIMIFTAIFISAVSAFGQTDTEIPPIPSDEVPEVLTRGPVNEAFAHPVSINDESDFIVSEEPPPDIEEQLPEEVPDGDQFAWIPGYWAWDTDRDEYIWVSGCWRAVPPGKYWVQGYWTEVEEGWRWVEGYWASVDDEEVEYLPEPPAVTYVAPPVTEVPGKIWVPSCWYWNNGYYTLRSGYWIEAREDWVWVPSHYVRTPRGYVFVSGHWDYPLHHRGVLFAPVYFPNIYRRVNYSYSLSIVLDLGRFEFGLFTRPRYRHYYFGDYYDSFYAGIGIYPWFECVKRYTWYDPIYLHDRWRHRKHNPRWVQHERNEYERRRANIRLRPPRTYREMERRIRNTSESRRKNLAVAVPMKKHIEKNRANLRYRKAKPEDSQQVIRRSNDIRRHEVDRRQRQEPEIVRKTTRSVLNRISSEKQKESRRAIERKKPEIKQPARRVYSNIRQKEPQEVRERKSVNSARIKQPEKRSTAPKYANIKKKQENAKSRASTEVRKAKIKDSLKHAKSRSDEEEETQRVRRRR